MMLALLDQIKGLHRQMENLDAIIANNSDKPLISPALSYCANQICITVEILGYYHNLWKSEQWAGLIANDPLVADQNLDRIMTVLKGLFILTISHVEFKTREIIEQTNNLALIESINRKEKLIDHFDIGYNKLEDTSKSHLRSFRKMLKDVPPFDSFSRIVSTSGKFKFIAEDELEIWDFLISARNTIVHNSGIGSVEKGIVLLNKPFLIKKGEMMQGDINFFYDLTEKLNELFVNWLLRVLTEAKNTI